MQVDQPLCYDCIHRVQDEVEVSIREAQQECAAYEAALARLREDDTQPYTDEVCSACPPASPPNVCLEMHGSLEIACAAHVLLLSVTFRKSGMPGCTVLTTDMRWYLGKISSQQPVPLSCWQVRH